MQSAKHKKKKHRRQYHGVSAVLGLVILSASSLGALQEGQTKTSSILAVSVPAVARPHYALAQEPDRRESTPIPIPTATPAPTIVAAAAPIIEPFANCEEATQAGVIPIPIDHPRYTSRLDSDGDGRGCEPTPTPTPTPEPTQQAQQAQPVETVQAQSSDCAATGLAAESGLTSNALQVLRCIEANFPAAGPYGGVASRAGASDHPSGHAVDAMIPDWSTSSGNSLGWSIAEYVRDNASRFSVTYVIFDAKIWSTQRSSEGWRAYSSSGDPTAAHLDHVHVSVS